MLMNLERTPKELLNMHDFKVGDYAYTVIHHLELYGEPKTEIHGKVVGMINGSTKLEVPYYGVFNVPPTKLIKETKDD